MIKLLSELLNIRNIFPALLFILMAFLGLRQLSDPDLGFHLQYGKYIIEQKDVPHTDITTTGAFGNEYIDSQWGFQLMLYMIYSVTGYTGISIFIAALSVLLAFLLLKTLRSQYPVLSSLILLPAILLIEPRLVSRPEVLSFILMLLLLNVLNDYLRGKTSLLWTLPLIMLLWVNIHSLFIIGLFIITAYFVTEWAIQKIIPVKHLIVLPASVAVCFINPYGLKLVLFPFGLLSRFSGENVFNEHIAEFQPFFKQTAFTLSDYLFVLWAVFILLIIIKNYRRINPAIIIITGAMLVLSLVAIRNIPLFAISSVLLLGQGLNGTFNETYISRKPKHFILIAGITLFITMIIMVSFNRWYKLNKQNISFGIGIDKSRLPEDAACFITDNKIRGSLINSLGAGGWLSWRLQQKVLIDGRLEVMGEALYKNVENSFRGALPALISKFNGEVIVYNYRRYHPWTVQLRNIPGWRLVFLDGLYAVFLPDNKYIEIPSLDELSLTANMKEKSYNVRANAGMFCLQYGYIDAAGALLQSALKGMNDEWIKQALRDVVALKAESKSFESANPSFSRKEAELHLTKGNEFFKTGNTDEAANEFKLAIKSDSTYAQAYNNLGNILAIRNDLNTAVQYFNKALNLDNELADAYFGRGSCYHYLGNKSKACNDWKTAVRFGNKKAQSFIDRYCH